MRKNVTITSLLLCFLLLTGCGSTFQADTSTVYVEKNGKILAASIEKFDKNYYSEDGLKTFITNHIESYTSENGKNSVKMTSFKIKDEEAVLYIRYKTAQDYASFNGEEFFSGTLPAAMAAGYDFSDTYYEVNKNATGNASTREQFLENSDLKVMITGEKVNVKIDGNIKYISNNAELVDSNTVKPSEVNTDTKYMTVIYQ